MAEKGKAKRPVENVQIKRLRKEVESLLAEPAFAEMAKVFRDTLAQRMQVEEIPAGGLLLQAKIPAAPKEKVAKKPKQKKGRPSYANIYKYRFW